MDTKGAKQLIKGKYIGSKQFRKHWEKYGHKQIDLFYSETKSDSKIVMRYGFVDGKLWAVTMEEIGADDRAVRIGFVDVITSELNKQYSISRKYKNELDRTCMEWSNSKVTITLSFFYFYKTQLMDEDFYQPQLSFQSKAIGDLVDRIEENIRSTERNKARDKAKSILQ